MAAVLQLMSYYFQSNLHDSEHRENIFLTTTFFPSSGQMNMIRPSKASVKFAPGPTPPNPRANSALYNTITPNNYRRF